VEKAMPTKKNKVTKKPAKKTAKVATKKVVTPPVPPTPPAPPPAPPAPPKPVPPAKSEADKIWDEIKNLSIQMFGLPEQYVLQHVTPISVEPSALYVTIRSTATLPSLEAAIAPAFMVELADKFVIIKRAPKPLIPSKQR
jgi:hypothetical protein